EPGAGPGRAGRGPVGALPSAGAGAGRGAGAVVFVGRIPDGALRLAAPPGSARALHHAGPRNAAPLRAAGGGGRVAGALPAPCGLHAVADRADAPDRTGVALAHGAGGSADGPGRGRPGSVRRVVDVWRFLELHASLRLAAAGAVVRVRPGSPAMAALALVPPARPPL